jgi:glyoxylase-like metal-dependent hydrolase (beta-lactamase superfamily II)
MQITPIQTGTLKLDGGAMFGIVPRKLWSRMITPDSENMCTWSMRALLIRRPSQVILVDTGIGDKQDARFRGHFSPEGQDGFETALLAEGVRPDMITDVLLTHLHFDHSGGAIRHAADGRPEPFCPNARYWTSERHFRAAMEPNAREKASFLQENFAPLMDWGLLHFAGEGERIEWQENIDLLTVYGHTEAMYLPIIRTGGRPLVYCADLIPSFHHLGLPYVMAYDIRPLDTLAEKARLLEWALDNEAILVFEHDPQVEACLLDRDAHGRIVPRNPGRLADLL